MNHPDFVSGRNQTQKAGDHKLQNVSRGILIVLAISILILTSMGSAHALPIVQTNAATNITDTSAQLNGVITPLGKKTIWEFQWGKTLPTTPFLFCGWYTIEGEVAQTNVPTSVSCQATGLQPSTTYEFQLVGVWQPTPACAPPMCALTYGSILDFTTLPSTTPSTSCSLMISVAPFSQAVVQGGTAVFSLSMSLNNPSCGGSPINLNNMDVTGLGPGMNWQLTPSEDGIAITTSPNTPPGPYALSLIYSVNGVQQQIPFTLIVNQATSVTTPVPTTQAFSYSVTVSPSSQSVQIGGTTSYVVSVLPVAGTPTPVSLTVMGLPGNVRSSFTTQSGTPPYTSTLNVDLSTSTANPGAYTLTVVGNAAGNVQSATATLTIEQKPTPTTIISPTTDFTTPVPPPPSDNSGLIIIAALIAIVVMLGILLMRSRGRRTTTQQAGAPRTFCAKCGTENPATNEFCVSCGNKLKTS